MPGNIENSVYFNDNQYGVPGSGKFRVQNNVGDTARGDSITVFYSITQTWYDYVHRKEIKNLVKGNLSPTDGIQFRYDTAFSKTLHPDRYKTLDVAIKQWVCLNNVNFSLGDSIIPTHDSVFQDQNCVIQFGTLPMHDIAKTKQWIFGACGLHIKTTEIDIIINKTLKDSLVYNIVCGDSIPVHKYDAYAILLHELGHAHSLNHVDNYYSIMYWAARPSDVNPIMGGDRKVFIKDDLSADAGSAYVMAMTHDTSMTNCTFVNVMSPLYLFQCDTLPMRLSSAGSYLISSCYPWVSEIHKEFSNLILFPNPAQNILTMNFTSEILQKNYISIYDIWGKKLLKQKYETFYGENSIQIDVKNLQSGIYCIRIDSNEGKLYYKFIKE